MADKPKRRKAETPDALKRGGPWVRTKPPLPPRGQRPFVHLVFDAELCCDFKRYSTGELGMSVERVTVSVLGKELGWVDLCAGGGILIHDLANDKSYSFSGKDIWLAYAQAKEAQRNG